MSKEKILEEFDKRFYFSDGILCETIGNNGHSCNLDDIKDFVKYVITQTREETIKEIEDDVKTKVALNLQAELKYLESLDRISYITNNITKNISQFNKLKK